MFNVQRATERRNVVLGLMNRHGFITKRNGKASKVPVTDGLKPATEQTMPHTLHLWMQ